MFGFEKKLSRLICDYSLKIKEGDVVEIRGEVCAESLIRELYKYILEIGAYPLVRMNFSEQLHTFYKYASEKQLSMIPEILMTTSKTLNALIHIDSESNTRQLTNIDPSKIAFHRKSTKILKDIMFEREAKGEFKWVIVPYPTSAMAQDAEMPLEEYANFIEMACKLDEDDPVKSWEDVNRKQQNIVERLTGTKKLRIVGYKTDLTLNTDRRSWINCSGRHNLPDGEVFTSPVEDSANGEIFFDIPTSFMGVEVQGVHLTFENGAVVRSSAQKGEEFLKKMIETDESAKFVGEIAFGLNNSITIPSKNILFDEKIGKTIHLAIGSSYPEAGGKNRSGLHWDLIKEMKSGGKVYKDDILIYENGEFLIEN
ncbi:MAG: aminopeptidase [Calditerrivibrio sp.]|nr:aminopeptidase [Calditerrivibrio sp.]MCA1932778.1 aminopeptidase [Calditerrivibrio sp.]MCA1980666.1 aminopeptidase [Calditerrivibrio sp.]